MGPSLGDRLRLFLRPFEDAKEGFCVFTEFYNKVNQRSHQQNSLGALHSLVGKEYGQQCRRPGGSISGSEDSPRRKCNPPAVFAWRNLCIEDSWPQLMAKELIHALSFIKNHHY